MRRKSPLAFEQRQRSQVLTFNAQHIESVEARPFTTEQQLVEVGAPVRFEVADLSSRTAECARTACASFVAELRPMLERVAVARHEFAPMAANLCQRTEAV